MPPGKPIATDTRYPSGVRISALILALWLVPAGLALAGSSREHATLTLVDRAPLTVRGAGFKARDTVRLTVRGDAVASRTVRATVGGRFVAVFPAIAADRCSLQRVAAIGRSGAHAELKLLPSPACLPG